MQKFLGVLLAVVFLAGCVDRPDSWDAPNTTQATRAQTEKVEKFAGESVGQEQARTLAASLLAGGFAWSRKALISSLESDHGISPTDAAYGVDAQGRNWSKQAAKYARGGLAGNQVGGRSRPSLMSYVTRVGGFTEAEAAAGIDSLGLDYIALAASEAKKVVGAFPYRLDLIDHLKRSGFTAAEAEGGVNLLGCLQMRCDGGP